ncbi:hypothetical protein [Pseudomonas japonica]|uniref:Uncharacterized protein n=1 Tax=Pseudomonas japonica TaxID=256466 RepID=A0A239GLF9_9PSED|nr:hypothetical protein [Pseudomonas japonica]SNS69997.1 hypothetical protein SAMN05444352_11355 [Pseudomonas japonica]
MRLHSLLTLTAVASLLLPMAAHAGPWPAGKKGEYMDECVQVAKKQNPGIDVKQVDAHCKCGADAIEKNFTTQQIEDLDSSADGVEANLKERAQQVVRAACAPKK